MVMHRMHNANQCKVLSNARFWSKREWKICVLHSVGISKSVLITHVESFIMILVN